MKKIIIFTLIIAMCIGCVPARAAFDSEFYRARDAYAQALDSSDNYAICTAVDKMVSLIPNPSSVEEYRAVIWAVYQGAAAYEKIGNYQKSAEYCKKYIEYAKYLECEAGENHAENIRGYETLLNHIDVEPRVFFESSSPKDSLYYGAKHESKYGAFNGMAVSAEKTGKDFDTSICNAYSLYVAFFDENIEQFSYKIPSGCDYLQIAWNVQSESLADLERIANGSCDDYITKNLSYLSKRNEKILLRFGAEINVWESIPEDEAQRSYFVDVFKKAYKKVATLAHTYAPNAALVYSPNDISNWYVDAKTFYPGDEYVDWIGISCYPNKVTGATGKIADYVDAYYCRGLYENPLVRIKNIVDAFGERKPIFISECGFAYGNDGVQTTEHALAMGRQFYTYVTMIYPQVKGIIYFNNNLDKDFSLETNTALKTMYLNAISENPDIQASLDGTSMGYSAFDTIDEKLTTLKLYTYAAFPNGAQTSVNYILDSNPIFSQNEAPYSAQIDVSSFGVGAHTLTISVSSGLTQTSKDYLFYVGRGGYVSTKVLDDTIAVVLDGEEIEFDQPPVAENGRTLVPLRKIFEALGASVEWDGQTQTVISQKGDITIKLTLGEKTMYVNETAHELDVSAKAISGRTLVPVRAISQAMNCKVDWDGATKTVIITTR